MIFPGGGQAVGFCPILGVPSFGSERKGKRDGNDDERPSLQGGFVVGGSLQGGKTNWTPCRKARDELRMEWWGERRPRRNKVVAALGVSTGMESKSIE